MTRVGGKLEVPDFRERLARFGSSAYRELRPAQIHVLDAYAHNHLSTPDLAIELPTGVGKTPAAQLHAYHDGQALGLMNYWVYFNSSPVVRPGDLVIFDDAHIAEQPLSGLFTLRIPRLGSDGLYQTICDLVLAHAPETYESLRALRDGSAPLYTPPELLTFSDWSAISRAVEDAIGASSYVQDDDLRYVWPDVRGRLARCGVLIGPTTIEIRPYHPPTQTLMGYSQARQRIYLSATLGAMDDLQRRLGIGPPVELSTPPQLAQARTGRRLFLINPGSDDPFDAAPWNFVLQQAKVLGRTAWLCSSNAEADRVEQLLIVESTGVFRIRAGDDGTLDDWRRSRGGHLVAAGRFDGLDFADDECRLVILPSVPAASTEFERFAVAYLGDATFMRHRVGQRVTQALGRANRGEHDWAVYVALARGFQTILADPAVTVALSDEVRPTIHAALTLHGGTWLQLGAIVDEFTSGGSGIAAPSGRRPGRASRMASTGSGQLEVEAATALWLGDYIRAAERADDAARSLQDDGEVEHAAFWRYVNAHALYSIGRPQDMRRATAALESAVASSPNTAWFVRLRRTVDELQARPVQAGAHDALFLAWEDWIREAGPRITAHVTQARSQLSGTHDQQAEALLTLARLCGARAFRPPGASAPDCIWSWFSVKQGERRVWEIKTGTGPERVPRDDINQVLGQLAEERRHGPRSRTAGCLVTPQMELAPDAAAAAADSVAVLHVDAVHQLFDTMADRLRGYLQRRGSGTATERGEARTTTEQRLPVSGWLERLLAPSSGRCRSAQDVQAEFR